jgi:DNA-binding LacI/PurR family transcriptional regulator
MNDHAIQQIRRDIAQGAFPARKLPSLVKLSKMYDVSFSKIRSIIQQLADEQLVTVKSRSGIYVAAHSELSRIGLLLAEGARWYVGALVGGVASACNKRGWDLIVAEAGNPEREETCLMHLLDRADMLLYVPRRDGQTEVARTLLRDNHRQIVFVDRRPEPGEYDIPVVSADNLSGGRMAAQYFLDLRPNRLFVISESEGSAVRERIGAFRERLLEAERERTTLGEPSALTLDPVNVYKSPFMGALAGYDAFQHFDRYETTFSENDGIFATTDATACGFRQAISDARKKNPDKHVDADKVKMLGFDGEAFLNLMQDRFPSIVQDFWLIGRKAVEVAQRRFNGQPTEAVSRIAIRISDKGSPSYARRELAAARQLEWAKANERHLLAHFLRWAPLYVRYVRSSDTMVNRQLPASSMQRAQTLRKFELDRYRSCNTAPSQFWLPRVPADSDASRIRAFEKGLAAFLGEGQLPPNPDLALSFFGLPLQIAISVKGRTDKLLWANPAALQLVGVNSLASAQGLTPGDIWAADDAATIAQQDSLLLEQPGGHCKDPVKVAFPKLVAHGQADQPGGTRQRISVHFLFPCPPVFTSDEARGLEHLMLGVISYWLDEFDSTNTLEL